MSSMRNAVQRRNHKERAQPLERQKWGILEKHKDYSLRAKDHNEKKRRLKALRSKAADRNPDEFAFGMMSSTTKNGVRQTSRGVENGTTGPLSMDVAKLLKTQDQGYLQTVLQQTRRERERVEKDVVLVDTGVKGVAGSGRRTVFDDEGNMVEEVTASKDVDAMDDEMEESESKSEDEKLSKEQLQLRRRKKRSKEVLHTRLEALREREKSLNTALDRLEAQRAKMHNTVGGVNKDGVKFKVKERKR